MPGHAGRELPTTVWYPTTGGPWPLVVFAHGYNTTPAAYAALTSAIASQGYVVAAPAMPGERSDVPGTPTQGDIPNEPRDLSLVIDRMLAAGASPASFLSGRVDGSRIGAMGHSDGGVVAAALASNTAVIDRRLRATVALSGGLWTFPGGQWGADQSGALLVGHGDADPIAPYSGSVGVYRAARSPRGLLTVLGGGHEAPYTGSGAQPDAVRASIADFFDYRLRGDLMAVSRLYTDGNRPGLTRLSEMDGMSADPIGHYDAATRAGNQAVHVVAWSIDPDADIAVEMAVMVDGHEVLVTGAELARAELPMFFPSFSANHGLDTNVAVGPGAHEICLRARNTGHGTDTVLGCKTVTVFPQVVGGPAVANHDGRLEVFVPDADGTTRHTFQTTPGGSWSAWYPLGASPLRGQASVATNSDGRLEVFGVGDDGQIWHVFQVCAGCSWSPWYLIGGAPPGGWRPDRISIAANGDGRLEVFAVGVDGSLQHSFQPAPQAGWSPWYSMNPPWTPSTSTGVAGVVAGRQADGRLVAVTVDASARLVVDVQAGPGVGWAPWQDLGGSVTGTPELGVNQDLRLETFVVGTDGRLWHSYITGSATWSAASALGGSFDGSTRLAVTNSQDQRIEVFGSAPSTRAVMRAAQTAANGAWATPTALGATGWGLAAANNPDGRIELFTTELPVAHAFQLAPNGPWSPFYPL